MIRGRFNVVIDSSWGSSGKGKVCSWLANKYGVTDASTCNMPNAGHTVEVNGERTVYKVLPAASHFGAASWLGPGAVIDEERLMHEIGFGKSGPVFVHERAGHLMPEHAEQERAKLSKISSTMQGSAACLCEKLMRQGMAAVWGSEERGGLISEVFRSQYLKAIKCNRMVLHEVAQGWGLSVDHGTHYPYCTSRNCGVGRALDDMAVPPQLIGDVYAVVRTYPIRVGNTADGYSGDFLPDQQETSWEEIEAKTGLEGLAKKELTTVTKRVRRVATFSHDLLNDCIVHNGVTKLVVSFAEYLNKDAFKATAWVQLPVEVLTFCAELEEEHGVPVVAVSTGPDVLDMAVNPRRMP